MCFKGMARMLTALSSCAPALVAAITDGRQLPLGPNNAKKCRLPSQLYKAPASQRSAERWSDAIAYDSREESIS
jgi:hypothetical protein